ncbi:hypothetical protein MRX96_016472 [Rhipicephalus microplus]
MSAALIIGDWARDALSSTVSPQSAVRRMFRIRRPFLWCEWLVPKPTFYIHSKMAATGSYLVGVFGPAEADREMDVLSARLRGSEQPG